MDVSCVRTAKARQGPSPPLSHSTRPLLARQHIDRLALAWRKRERDLDSPTLHLSDLLTFDGRLMGHRKALALLAVEVDPLLAAAIDEPLGRGDAFVLALWSLDRGSDAFAAALGENESLASALASALVWAPEQSPLLSRPERWPAHLWPHCTDLFARAELQGTLGRFLARANHDTHTDLARLRRALYVHDPALRAVALGAMESQSHGLRGAAAHWLLIHGNAEQGRLAAECLRQRIGPDRVDLDAVRTLVTLSHEQALPVLATLARRSEDLRPYLLALGWCGCTEGVPILAGYLDHAEYALIATRSLMTLTGSEPVADHWQAESTATQAAPAGPERGLPWPSREGFERWWQRHQVHFNPRGIYLAGHRVSAGGLRRLLATAPLGLRPLIAERLQHLERSPRFPTALPAVRQYALLSPDEVQ